MHQKTCNLKTLVQNGDSGNTVEAKVKKLSDTTIVQSGVRAYCSALPTWRVVRKLWLSVGGVGGYKRTTTDDRDTGGRYNDGNWTTGFPNTTCTEAVVTDIMRSEFHAILLFEERNSNRFSETWFRCERSKFAKSVPR